MDYNYDTRTYNLVANAPQNIPAGREYLIISASVDRDALQIAVGDANASFAQWPIGIAPKVKDNTDQSKMMTARILSTVTQTVTIAFVSGDIEVRDARTLITGQSGIIQTQARGLTPGAGGSTNAFSANASPVLVAAGANLNGVEVYSVSYQAHLQAVSSSVIASISANAGNESAFPFFASNGAAGPVNQSMFTNFENPVRFSSGVNVNLNITGTGTFLINVSALWRVL